MEFTLKEGVVLRFSLTLTRPEYLSWRKYGYDAPEQNWKDNC